METWLTYLAALLMAGATAFTFPSSSILAKASALATAYIIEVATLLFLPVMVVTVSAGVASLRKDKLGRKTLATTLWWAVISTAILSLAAALLTYLAPQVFPTTSSAGAEYEAVKEAYVAARSPMALIAPVLKLMVPALLGAWILGSALTPSTDIIRPAYTVMNSFSEAMYRIERTATYFGGLFVYVSGTAFFLNVWQEKTFIAAPKSLLALCLALGILILLVIPFLYAIFTGFKRNPYGIIGRSLAAMILGCTTSNLFAAALVNESICRCNLGTQKRISSVSIPVSILFTRGGTAFVSAAVTLTMLQTLGAELSLSTAIIIALVAGGLSFSCSMNVGYEVLVVTVATLKLLKIDSYGAEAAIVAILPVLNGLGIMLDTLLGNMAASIISVNTKTDARIPLQDTI